jgi:methionine-rich copper-binding protein CopC
MKKSLLLSATILLSLFLSAQTNLISYASAWKYLDNGSNQGTAWKGTGFNDVAWASANAPFGYGTSGITTTVSFGGNSKKKDITTYFRKTINIANASIYSGYTLNLKRDDGAVVYVNGTEVYRSNMPTGAISFSTKASTEATDNGTAIQTITLSAGALLTGANVIAVEIHQFANNGPDLFFDFQLNGIADVNPPTVINYSPADNATGVLANSNLVLTFSESIQKGTGNILIKEGGITIQTIDVTSANVTVSGNTATINPADFSFGSAVNVEIAAGVFKDLSNNNYAGISNATTWNFNVVNPDLIAPTVITYSPTDDATGVLATTNLVLTFSENVQKGTGNILIKEGGVTTQTIDVTSESVTVSGNTITIDPANFTYNAAVNVEMAAGVFKDLSNNNYAGIADAATWNFNIENPDLIAPTATDYSPADNATGILANSNLVLTFSENVQKGTGNILIKEGGITTQTIDVTSASVSVSGNTVTIDPANFTYNAAVNVEIAAGAFKDLSNNNYAGITDAVTWNFNVENPDLVAPTVITYSPADDASGVLATANLVLTFSENIQKGTGNILIKEGGVTTQTIDVTSASVTVSGNTVTIDPANFTYNAAVNIEMAAGALKDLSNNNYAGISDAITWNFDVENPDLVAPTVITYSPIDNATGVLSNSNLVLTFNENIQKGTGNILIKEGGITTQTIDVTSASVTVSGNTVTIDPANFTYNAAVNVEIASGAFKDLSNNNYAGITDATTWNFNIENPDLVAPTVTTYSPVDNASNVVLNANLVLTFSENIQKGTGNILIKEGGVTTQTINVTSASVTVSGNTVTIDPANFTYSAAVNIEMAAGTFKDLSNNNYAGITNATTWNFTIQAAPSGPQTLVAYGATWKYLDNGTNQGTAWKGTGFNDASWAAGPGQLGYGDGDEATVVSYGPDVNNKYITTYFRKTISIADASIFTSIAGSVKRDDGIAIYINGTEVYRNTLAAGALYNTFATAAVSDDGATPQTFNFSPSVFVSGNNVIAVEIHQNAGTSTDISFDLQLIGNTNASITRGPYMNSALQTGVVIRWRTDIATNSKVNFGNSVGSLTQSVTDNTNTTEHIITLTGLNSNTLYYYNIGSTTQVLQGDASNYFKTMPLVGSTQKIRFLAMGDMGNNSTNQVNVRNAYLTFNGSNYTDGWILMGDNAYNSGTDSEFQSNFFNIYQGNLTKNHVLWPSPGNHDYANSTARQADHVIPYYDMFTLPSAGQAGGLASNTEAFYSYNYGNVHFVSLDSYGWEAGSTRLYDTLGAQAVWLKQDLAANTQPWTVVYFHHPPYTKGSHNSDTETELINMRQNIVRILERYKVDMVLNGHSHDYERSYLINGHYGVETTFSLAANALSSSSAKYDGTANSCIYIKNPSDPKNGIVYAVVGSAGQLGGTTTGYPHDAMYYSNSTVGGALYFEVENNRLNAKWICSDGVVRDNFTIMKDVNKTTNLSIPSGTPTQISASWEGNYSWSTGATTKAITVSPTSNSIYTITDGSGCITDVFNITVTGGSARYTQVNTSPEASSNTGLKVIPTLVKRGQQVVVQLAEAQKIHASVIDVNGKAVQKFEFYQTLYIPTEKLKPGVYFIRFDGKFKQATQKFVVME